MPNIATKCYRSTDTGAPTISNTWGDMINLLDNVLINGYNVRTVSSITRSGSTCTVTTSTAHGYTADQVLVISGANETEYNTELTILTIPTTTSFTFTIVGTPATPATGTMSVKVAPLNWTTVFTASGQRIYRSNNSNSAKNCLRIDDFQTTNWIAGLPKSARVGMAQNFGDVNTPIGAQAPYDYSAPTKNWVGSGSAPNAYFGWWKWYYARAQASASGNTMSENNAVDSNARKWAVVGDDRGFYVFNTMGGSAGANTFGLFCHGFTDIISYKAGDIYNTMLIGADAYITNSATWTGGSGSAKGYSFTDVNDPHGAMLGKMMLRDHTGIGSAISVGFRTIQTTLTTNLSSGYSTGVLWPNVPDYSLLLHPFYIAQSDNNIRGILPGVYYVLNNMSTGGYSDFEIITGVNGYPGRKFINLKMNTGTTNEAYSNVMVDITGPWW